MGSGLGNGRWAWFSFALLDRAVHEAGLTSLFLRCLVLFIFSRGLQETFILLPYFLFMAPDGVA